MHDPRLEKLARVIVHYSLAVRKGDLVLINGAPAAEPAIVAAYREVLRAGGHPWVQMQSDQCREVLLKVGSADQLKFTHPFDLHVMKKCNARIYFWAEENTRYLANVASERQAQLSQGRKPIMEVFFRREAKPADDPDHVRWVGTQFPTNASAQDAEMSLAEYEDFVYRAGKLNLPNPEAAWKKMGQAQQRLCDELNRAEEMHIRVPNGTDIRFGIAGRRWINCDGRANFPDGEVFTGPLEHATEGTICYNFPAVFSGREVDGIRLQFRGGKVVDCSATKNEEFLIKMIEQDKGARVFGELALGTNYSIRDFSRNTLFDEKIGGTFHTALGASIPESGGVNKSGLHWDLVCDLRKGGTVEVDGRVISRNGKFAKPNWPR